MPTDEEAGKPPTAATYDDSSNTNGTGTSTTRHGGNSSSPTFPSASTAAEARLIERHRRSNGYTSRRVSIKERVSHFTWAWFGCTMSTGAGKQDGLTFQVSSMDCLLSCWMALSAILLSGLAVFSLSSLAKISVFTSVSVW